MKIIFLSVISVLFGFNAFAQIGIYPNSENLRSDTIDVLDYEIHLDITDFSGKTISGYTKVQFTPKMTNVSVLNLDLLKFEIDSIIFNGSTLGYSYNDTLLTIQLGGNYNVNDTLDVTVFYHGLTRKDPSGWGGFYFGNNYAFNLGVGFEDKPHNVGRYWFPCFDNFKERSTYNLYITTNDNQFATSIGDLISSNPMPNNKTEWYWKMEETIPTYLAMVAVNYYTVVNDNYNGINGPIPIKLYAKSSDTNNLKGSFIHLKDCMAAFEGLYGPYPFNKIGYTVVNFSSGAMEHASNITYPNNAVNGNTASEDLMAHELSHQWWGNYATTLTPEDMWLNEGMASFSANYFIEHKYGWETAKVGVKSTLFNILKKAHINEGGYLAISGVPHELTYGDHVYRKGSLVAQNLRMLLGENNFGPAVTSFLNSRAYDNMTSIQYRDYLQNTTSADVIGFFDGWVFNGGFPDYEIDSVQIIPTTGDYEVTIDISQKLNHAPSQFSETPLEIGFYNSNFDLITQSFMVGPNQTSINTTVLFNPVMVTLNPNNKLCYSTTDDIKVITQTGLVSFPNAMMNLTVLSVNDSALLKIEHHWSAPDPIKDWTKPYRLSNYRYWKVDGIIPIGFETEAKFLYDGRESGGYLDSLLVNITEDSLVLLYRKNASDDWTEYPYYTKNMIGGPTNKFGQMELSKLVLGEYTLANIDHTVLGLGFVPKEDHDVKIYPNPTSGKVTIEWDYEDIPQTIEVFSLDGKLMLSFIPSQENKLSFNSVTLKSGIYFAKITINNVSEIKQFSVSHLD